jgi:tetratricopeptide (TPR) repeat protein
MLKIGFAMKTIHLFLGLLLIGLVACGGEQNNAASQMPDETPTSPNPTIDMLSRKIEATPNDPKLYSARARLFYENGGYDEAISDLKQAMSIDSLNPDFHHLRACSDFTLWAALAKFCTALRYSSVVPSPRDSFIVPCSVQNLASFAPKVNPEQALNCHECSWQV